jgi:hypothetical protein
MNCVEASADLLPYSFCVPPAWRVSVIADMDGSVDVIMLDETGELLGFGGASGPVEPSGQVNRFVPFPQKLVDAQERQRLLSGMGFEPKAVRDLVIDTFPVDGLAGSLLTLTLDIGESEPQSRVYELRVPVQGGAGIELLFVFGASEASEGDVRDVLSSIQVDASLVEANLEHALSGPSS